MKMLCLIWDIWNSISELCLWLFADKPVGVCVSSDKTHDEHMKVTAGIVRKITLIAEGFWVHKGLKEHPLWWEVAGRKTCQFQEPLWLPCSEF